MEVGGSGRGAGARTRLGTRRLNRRLGAMGAMGGTPELGKRGVARKRKKYVSGNLIWDVKKPYKYTLFGSHVILRNRTICVSQMKLKFGLGVRPITFQVAIPKSLSHRFFYAKHLEIGFSYILAIGQPLSL